MSGELTRADREALMDACPIALTPTIGDHDALFAVVESVVAQKVAAGQASVLFDAADDLRAGRLGLGLDELAETLMDRAFSYRAVARAAERGAGR